MTAGTLKTPKALITNTNTPTKPGKVTIPKHCGDLDPKTVESILKQAGIK